MTLSPTRLAVSKVSAVMECCGGWSRNELNCGLVCCDIAKLCYTNTSHCDSKRIICIAIFKELLQHFYSRGFTDCC